MKNGFDLSQAIYPEQKIITGVPSRDEIPSIDKPHLVDANEANFLNDDDIVLGLEYHGVTRAYPKKILNWHQVVNDELNGIPVAVTFCPLCGSGMSFLRDVEGQTLSFGVSGLVYNNNVLFFDRQSDSLWCQIERRSISGPLKEKALQYILTHKTRWGTWKNKHPQTRVLSTRTGYMRYYDREPYTGYEKRNQIFFPLEHQDDRYHPKEWVAGLEVNGVHKVYPMKELSKAAAGFEDQVGGKRLWIHYSVKRNFLTVKTPRDEAWPHTTMFWFAWMAFHPDSEVFSADNLEKETD